MKPRSRWIFFLSALTIWCTLLFGAYPFFAVNAPVKSDVLVVEGWLKPYQLDSVRALVLREGIKKVYTTGVVRPCSYHLRNNEAIEGELRVPVSGSFTINLAGLPGQRVVLVVDRDTLLDDTLDPKTTTRRIQLPHAAHLFKVVAPMTGDTDMTTPRVFIGDWHFEQGDMHQVIRELYTVDAAGRSTRVGPTWAHSAAILLHELGLPESMIVAKPTYGIPDHNTWTTAKNFADYAQHAGIRSFNVATLGVHARRTRGLFRRATGDGIDVGVISIYDTWCRREDWWKHWYGWWKVLKEIVGAPQPYTAE